MAWMLAQSGLLRCRRHPCAGGEDDGGAGIHGDGDAECLRHLFLGHAELARASV